MKRLLLMGCCLCGVVANVQAQLRTNEGIEYLQCQAPDVSGDFCDLANTYFLADSIAGFDLDKGEGLLNWKRYRMSPRQAFNLNGYWPVRMQMLDFPSTQYDNDPNLKIRVRKVDDRTLRVTLFTSPVEPRMDDADDPMFSPEFIAGNVGDGNARIGKGRWNTSASANSIVYRNKNGVLGDTEISFSLDSARQQGQDTHPDSPYHRQRQLAGQTPAVLFHQARKRQFQKYQSSVPPFARRAYLWLWREFYIAQQSGAENQSFCC